MKVKDLIKQLRKQDPEKKVMIQQGMEYDYTLAYSVKEMELVDMTDIEEKDEQEYIVIDYS